MKVNVSEHEAYPVYSWSEAQPGQEGIDITLEVAEWLRFSRMVAAVEHQLLRRLGREQS